MELVVGMTVKWTAEEGSHIGVVERYKNGRVSLRTNVGLLEMSDKDGTFKQTSEKPEVVVREVEAPAPKQVKAGTKLEQAVAIFKANQKATRQELIAAFVKQLGMTPAGASTYANQVKKVA